MSNRTTRTHRYIVIANLLGAAVLAAAVSAPLLAPATVAQTPADAIAQAMLRAKQSGGYRFNSDIMQVNAPDVTLGNVGRRSEVEQVYVEGQSDVGKKLLNLKIWSDADGLGGSVRLPDNAIELEVADGNTRMRRGSGPWRAADGAELYAPQGDVLAYLAALKDVRELGVETRHGLTYARYAFSIDGPAFARHTRDQMQAALRAQGALNGNEQLQISTESALMTGDGELWVDERGLPLRQTLRLFFPPKQEARHSAQITVNFFDYGKVTLLTPTHARAPLDWLPSANAYAAAGLSLALCIGGALMLIVFRRSRGTVIGVSLCLCVLLAASPILQQLPGINLLAAQRAGAAEREEAQADRLDVERSLRAIGTETQFDPHANPLASADVNAGLALAADVAAVLPGSDAACADESGADSDADGLSDCMETNVWKTRIDLSDTDADGISDFQEVGLGTAPLDEDSDGDGINDLQEIQGFLDAQGRRWYGNPLVGDSNGDGINDFVERGATATLMDTDGDGTPDLFDADNDNDSVPDNIDSAPFAPVNPANAPIRDGNALTFTLANIEPGRIANFDIQIRPLDPTHLRYAFTVLDWPNDRAGQVQDWDNKTFAQSLKDRNLIDGINSAAAADTYGDMRLIPELEITVDGTNGADLSQYHFPPQSKLEPYAINVITRTRDGSPAGQPIGVKLFVPLSLIVDPKTGARVAFGARIPYLGTVGAFNVPHQYRLVWSVHAQSDIPCDASDDAAVQAGCRVADGGTPFVANLDPARAADLNLATDKLQPLGNRDAAHNAAFDRIAAAFVAAGQPITPPISVSDSGYGIWQVSDATHAFLLRAKGAEIKIYRPVDAAFFNSAQVVQTYPDDWYVTGAHVTEDRGVRVATVYGDPAVDPARTADGSIWAVADGLGERFVMPLDDNNDDQPDLTVDDIASRFDHGNNGAATLDQRWAVEDNLQVDRVDYESQDFALASITMTRTKQLLARFNSSYQQQGPITPTLLVAQESTYRSVSLDEMRVSGIYAWYAGGRLDLNFAPPGAPPVSTDVVHSMQWNSYCIVPGTVASPIWQACDRETLGYGLVGLHRESLRTITDTESTLDGKVILLRLYYNALQSGTSSIVRSNGQITMTVIPDNDSQVRQAIEGGAGSITGPIKKVVNKALLRLLLRDTAALNDVATGNFKALAEFSAVKGKLKQVGRRAGLAKGMYSKIKLKGGKYMTGAAIGLALAGGVFGVLGATDKNPNRAQAFKTAADSLALAEKLLSTTKAVLRARLWVKAAGWATVLKGGSAFTGTTLKAGATMAVFQIAVTWGLFAYGAQGQSYGDPAFNASLATAIAMTIYLIFLAVLSATAVGSILVGILELLDAILTLVCTLNKDAKQSLGGKDGDCTIGGKIVGAIAAYLYARDVTIQTEAAKNPTLVQQGDPKISLLSPERGYMAGNPITLAITVTTNILQKDPEHWQVAVYLKNYFDLDELISTAFTYSLATTPIYITPTRYSMASKWTGLHSEPTRDYGVNWNRKSVHADQATRLGGINLTAGINKSIDYYFNMGYALPAYECWTIISVPKCSHETENGGTPNLTHGPVLDIFPNTVGEFFALTNSGNGGQRLNWDANFTTIWDADGDGLVSSSMGGNDPDDTNPDTDGDGLTDKFELEQRMDGLRMAPNQWDTDNDGLTDAQEVQFGTDPANADTDNDGLKDGEEVYHQRFIYSGTVQRVVPVMLAGKPVFEGGWQIAAPRWGQPIGAGGTVTMWVSSNPALSDSDGDGIPDDAEKALYAQVQLDVAGQPYNPNAANINPLQMQMISNLPGHGYVRPGAGVLVTHTLQTFATLDPGTLEINAPITLGVPLRVATIALSVGTTTTLAYAYTVDAGAVSQMLRLNSTAHARTGVHPASESINMSLSTEANMVDYSAPLVARGINGAPSNPDDPTGYLFAGMMSTSTVRGSSGDVKAYELSAAGQGTRPLDLDTVAGQGAIPDLLAGRGEAAPGSACNASGTCITLWDEVRNCYNFTVHEVGVVDDADDPNGGAEPVVVFYPTPAQLPSASDGIVVWSATHHRPNMASGTFVNESTVPSVGLPASRSFCIKHQLPQNPGVFPQVGMYEANEIVPDGSLISSFANVILLGTSSAAVYNSQAFFGPLARHYGTVTFPCGGFLEPDCTFAHRLKFSVEASQRNVVIGSVVHPHLDGTSPDASANPGAITAAFSATPPNGSIQGDFNPSIASDGSGFLSVWQRKYANIYAAGTWNVVTVLMGRRFDKAGAATGAEFMLAAIQNVSFPDTSLSIWDAAFANPSTDAIPSVIWAGDRYRLNVSVSSGDVTGYDILSNNTVATSDAGFSSAAGEHDKRNPPSLAYDPINNRVMSVYAGFDGMINARLTPVGGSSISLPNVLGATGTHPRVAYVPAIRGWMIARDATTGAPYKVRLLNADGSAYTGNGTTSYLGSFPLSGGSFDSTLGQSLVCPSPAASPVIAYPFEELPGATAFVDATGRNRPNALCNPATCPMSGVGGVGAPGNTFVGAGVPPRTDRALYFDGGDRWLTFPSLLGNGFTHAFWFKQDADAVNTGNSWQEGKPLLWAYDGGDGSTNYGVFIGAENRLNFGMGSAVARSYPLAPGQWHHVVATRNPVNGLNLLYVDGALVDGAVNAVPLGGNMPLYFNAGSSTNNRFKGMIDFFTAYDHPLKGTTIAALYDGTLKSDLGYSENASYCIAARPTLGTDNTRGFAWSKIMFERDLPRGAGPLTARASLEFNVDALPPTSQLTSLTAGQYVQATQPGLASSLVIAGSASDAGSGIDHVTIIVDGTAYTATGTATWLHSIGVAEGHHTLRSIATDHVGLVENNPVEIQIIADGKPPTMTVPHTIVRAQRSASGRWMAAVSGSISDPPIADGLISNGSGVDPSSLRVTVHNAAGIELLTQAATAEGSIWRATLELPDSVGDPSGDYSVTVSAADLVGNRAKRSGGLHIDSSSVQAKTDNASQRRDYISNQKPFVSIEANTGNSFRATHLDGTITSSMGIESIEGAFYSIEQTSALSGAVMLLSLDEPAWADQWFEDATLFRNAAHCLNLSGSCPTPQTTGRIGRALQFGGNSQLAVAHNRSIDFDIDSDFTLQLWIKTSTPNTTLLEKRGGDPFRGYALQLNAAGQLVAELNGLPFTGISAPLNDNAWHHVALVGSRDTLRATLYVDGVSAGRVNMNQSLANAEDLHIGGIGVDSTQLFVGRIDQVMISRRALSEGEIMVFKDMADVVWTAAMFVPGAPPTGTDNPVAGTWSMLVPPNLEHFHQLDLRVVDGTGKLFRIGNLWRGVIDNRPPRIMLSASATGVLLYDPASGAPRYDIATTITAQDQYLDLKSFDSACRNGNQPQRGYVQDAWMTRSFPDFTLRHELGFSCHVWALTANPVLTASVCDEYGNCANASLPVSTQNVLHRANATADPVLVWPTDGMVLAMGASMPITLAASSDTALRHIGVRVNGALAGQVDFTQAQNVRQTLARMTFDMPAAGENQYQLQVETLDWTGTVIVGPVTNVTLDSNPPSGNLINTEITLADAYDNVSGLMRFGGGAGDSLGSGNIASVQIAVGDGPYVDATWNGDGTWQTMAYVGANPYGQSYNVSMRSIDKAGRVMTDTHAVLINITPPEGFDAGAIPTLSITDVTINEAAGSATFVIQLSAAQDYGTVAVHVGTIDGSAKGGLDFSAVNGLALIHAGETTTTVSIAITSDTLREGNENFVVKLSAPVNATLAKAQGAATITDGSSVNRVMLPLVATYVLTPLLSTQHY